MNEGWIKVHRQLLGWEWFDNSQMVHLFLYLLLSASPIPSKWRGISLKRGQLATSRRKLAFMLNLSEKQVRTALNRLVEGDVIRHDVSYARAKHCVVITICNYDKYQDNITTQGPSLDTTSGTTKEPLKGTQATSSRARKGSPIKEVKKKEDIYSSSLRSEEGVEEASAGEEEIGPAFSRMFNEALDTAGSRITRVRAVSGARLAKLRARIAEHGREAVAEMAERAARSDFLGGKNQRGWRASVDWLLEPDNFQKVLEGTYDNPPERDSDNEEDTSTPSTTTTDRRHGKTTEHRGDSRRGDAAERERKFRARIIDKLNRPDEPEPDLSGCY